jgi:hypothetical protein
MIVTRAVQLQPNQKRGILMKTRRTVVNTIAVLTFSTMLMAAQMQMPASTPGTSKPAEASSAPKTLTGTVSDAMCGAHHMEKDKSAAECTRECVKKGTKCALVVGTKVYTLDGHEAELDKILHLAVPAEKRKHGLSARKFESSETQGRSHLGAALPGYSFGR